LIGMPGVHPQPDGHIDRLVKFCERALHCHFHRFGDIYAGRAGDFFLGFIVFLTPFWHLVSLSLWFKRLAPPPGSSYWGNGRLPA
jgi:hypothetical protein